MLNSEKAQSAVSTVGFSSLALHGGQKIRTKKFPAHRTIGLEEEEAALRVLRSGVLSRYLGTWHEDFHGGPEVQAFEREWAAHFGVKHAIAVNSATSGLSAAVGALGIGQGDEVIVSPYTMSASAVAPLVYGAVPVFADIEDDFYCLSAASIEKKITKRTKAIIVVDIFGQPYDVENINKLAQAYNLKIIEDCAQAPGALYGNRYAGTLGNIGIYSLNYHKHIHAGEGGVIVTNDDEMAEKLKLIRNHAEAVVENKGYSTLVNMIGFNFRLTEINAAIGREQLKKLKTLVVQRQTNVAYLEQGLSQIPCLEMPKIRAQSSHVYYLHVLTFNKTIAGIHRNKFVDAVKAELEVTELRETEGVKVGSGYVKPLYLQPMYQQKIAYGVQGYPWNIHPDSVDYTRGMCPIVERMYDDVVITHELMRPGMKKHDLDDVINAFIKVWELRKEL